MLDKSMSHFFAFLRRMRFIRRWSLMRNTMAENIQEHSLEVAWIAHQLGLLHNAYNTEAPKVDANELAILAMYHEVSEIFTGDMPTPIKYFDTTIRTVYGEIEKAAQEKMLFTLPVELQPIMRPYLVSPEEHPSWPLVKAADTLSAFMKCIAEKSAGNGEFNEAYETTKEKLEASPLPEVKQFMNLYLPSLGYSLDQLNYGIEGPKKK